MDLVYYGKHSDWSNNQSNHILVKVRGSYVPLFILSYKKSLEVRQRNIFEKESMFFYNIDITPILDNKRVRLNEETIKGYIDEVIFTRRSVQIMTSPKVEWEEKTSKDRLADEFYSNHILVSISGNTEPMFCIEWKEKTHIHIRSKVLLDGYDDRKYYSYLRSKIPVIKRQINELVR